MRTLLTNLRCSALQTLAVGITFAVMSGSFHGQISLRKDEWKQVKESVQNGLPKAAVEQLQRVIAGALRDKAYPEAIKAMAQKIALEGAIDGSRPEKRVPLMQAEIARAPREMKPLLHAILAKWYWHYFQQNRGRFILRPAAPVAAPVDFTAWDLPRLFREIDKEFTSALENDAELKKVPITEYDALLVRGTMPDASRPTLFDFLVHEALAFYGAGEQAGTTAEEMFDLSADSAIFAPAEEFLQWRVEASDAGSRTSKAIRLYQDLMRFHQSDRDRSAYLDADLDRLSFGFNLASGENKNDRYLASLQRFAEAFSTHEASAKALFREASVLQQESRLAEAHLRASRGVSSFPERVGGKLCGWILRRIEAKSLEINIERVWNDSWPLVQIRYRNLTKVYFRVVRADWQGQLDRLSPEYWSKEERKALLDTRPACEWSADLPATKDFVERTTEVAAPNKLDTGFYFLIASDDAAFGADNSTVSFTAFWVSKLALVLRTPMGTEQIEGFVLDASSGEPISGGRVQVWLRGHDRKITKGGTGQTDKNGLFSVQGSQGQSYLVFVRHGKEQLASTENNYVHLLEEGVVKQILFFTDLALYRPGQTVRYHGICIRVDRHRNDYSVLANHAVTVVFADASGKEMARQRQHSNDYGSISGSFLAPRDRAGRMSILVDGELAGSIEVSVQNYGQPKFRVTLDNPKVPARLSARVILQGKATADTGQPLNGARVSYRVVRQVNYPDWWQPWYGEWSPPFSSREIAHGSSLTARDGTFRMAFTAMPDATVPKEDEPSFRFNVYAHVTDSSGETYSAERAINLGYAALKASLAANEWQTVDHPVQVGINTQTLDGEGRRANVTLKVYELREPIMVQRAPLEHRIYATRRETIALKPDLSNPIFWELDGLVAQQKTQTDAAGKATASFSLKRGLYRVMLETSDRFGKPVTARVLLQVFEPDAATFPLKIPNVLAAPKWSLQVGETFQAVWGTGYSKGRAFIEILCGRKTIQSFWTDPNRTQVLIEQAVQEEMRGGFTLHVTMVRQNRAYLTSREVEIPWTNKNLTIRWERFTSRIEPGKRETWTAVITGFDSKKCVAEMVATLYDQSLDSYLPHQWLRRIGPRVGLFLHQPSYLRPKFENSVERLERAHDVPIQLDYVENTYRAFPTEISTNVWGQGLGFGDGRGGLSGLSPLPGLSSWSEGFSRLSVDPAQLSFGKDVSATAFFFPNLLADNEGRIKIQFTMPAGVKRWKFMGFVHDRQLRSGYLEGSVVNAEVSK